MFETKKTEVKKRTDKQHEDLKKHTSTDGKLITRKERDLMVAAGVKEPQEMTRAMIDKWLQSQQDGGAEEKIQEPEEFSDAQREQELRGAGDALHEGLGDQQVRREHGERDDAEMDKAA